MLKTVKQLLIISPLILTSCSSRSPMEENKISRGLSSQISSVAVSEIKASQVCPTNSIYSSEKDYKKLMSYANACITKQSWSTVEELGARMHTIDSDQPWGAYYMSVASEGRGHIERAQWMIQLALKKAPKIGLLKYQNGRILWNKKFLKEAVNEIELALEYDSNIMDANIFLGQIHLKELKFEKSKKYFEKAYSKDSKSFPVLYGLSSCYIELENPNDAIGILQRGIAFYPRSIDLRLQELFVYENQLKQLDMALSKYRELQNLVSKNKVDGQAPFDIAEKIKSLESTLNKRTLAKK